MTRVALLLGLLSMVIMGCQPTTQAIGSQQVYRIGFSDKGRIQFRMLDSVNALRSASGAPALQLNSRLNAAAETHSRDMAVQNRPWHFGSDGSSPIDRVRRVGYSGRLVGEAISETFETELETLAAWMDESTTRAIILDGSASELGFAWFQEDSGKIWWTLITGASGGAPLVPGPPPTTDIVDTAAAAIEESTL